MKRRYIAILALTTLFASCDDNALFEKEMYKNEVSLISKDDNNVFEEVVHMTGEEIIGYIAASAGGTDVTDKDLVLGLVENPEPLDAYNYRMHDVVYDLYDKLVPTDKYDILDDKLVIKAGERTGKTPIKLRPEGLSPDSTYFICLQVAEGSGVEVNPKKSNVLYKVSLQNDYASQAKSSLYTMSGLKDGLATAANKQLFPLTHNSVRMVAGVETFVSKVADIAKTSLILEVDEFNNVTIKPYKDIVIIQLDNDPLYSNSFHVEESYGRRKNVFLLSYDYSLDGGTTYTNMKERVEMYVVE